MLNRLEQAFEQQTQGQHIRDPQRDRSEQAESIDNALGMQRARNATLSKQIEQFKADSLQECSEASYWRQQVAVAAKEEQDLKSALLAAQDKLAESRRLVREATAELHTRETELSSLCGLA